MLTQIPFMGVDTGGQSQQVALAGSGVAGITTIWGAVPPSTQIVPPGALAVAVMGTTPFFMRQTPTNAASATASGTDKAYPANFPVIVQVAQGNYLSVNSAAAGTIFFSPA